MTVSTDSYSNPEFEFSDRIRKVRRDIAHLDQAGMAEELGVNLKQYAAWETGRTMPRNVIAIAKRIALRWPGVTADWVLGVERPPVPPTPPGVTIDKPTDCEQAGSTPAGFSELRPTG